LLSDKIAVKPNFIEDLAPYRQEAEGFGVFIGRLGVEKGVDFLLSAIKKAGNLRFKIVGDGPLAQCLEDKQKNLHLQNVEFCGYKAKEDALSMLGRASFLVLPSIWYEGFPMVILEAMSLGKPVITTSLGGLPEIIRDGYNGFLVPPGDADALAEKIKMLVNDRTLCENLGQNARREYEVKYTPEKNYEMLMSIYRNVIERKKSTAS
jgi:glycosyltransferase involved in cell wall biosynthesis